MVVGEPGIGKTRLAAELSTVAAADDMRVVWGRCWEAGGAPVYWPWSQGLRQLDYTFDLSGHTRGGDDRSGPSRFRLFDDVATFLRKKGDEHPLLLVLDDVHSADESSLLLLNFVARSLIDSRVLVVASYDDALARAGRTHSHLVDAGREGERISLRGLDQAAVAELIRATTGVDAPDSIAHSIHTASDGNPFFVLETIKLLMTRGDVHRGDYSFGFKVPDGVADVVRRRLEMIDDELLRILSAAAVLGRSFDVSLLSAIVETDLSSTLGALSSATQLGIVEEQSSLGGFRFVHALVRETLYEDLPTSRRMELHRRIAEGIEAAHPKDLDSVAAELAHHWFKAAQAGDVDKTLAYGVRAAERAMDMLAFEEAERLYRRALQVAALGASGGPSVADLEAALETVAARSGRTQTPGITRAPSRFSREGDFWTIEYRGKLTRLRHTKGLAVIAFLLSRPGVEIHVLDLTAAVEGTDAAMNTSGYAARAESLSIASDDAGEVIDASARAAYKARLSDLRAEVEEARMYNDKERSARAQTEIEALIAQLGGGMGLGGRARRAGSHSERARVRIQKTVKDAFRKIDENNPQLSGHLAVALRTGTFCSYTPDPDAVIDWNT